jgi:hypothetical protein
LINSRFVALACNDWYLRRQEDAAGNFWRRVSSQGPNNGQGGSTRQGRYVFTVAGKLLGFNNNRGPERLLQTLRESLKAWDALPVADRTADAEQAPDRRDPQFDRHPPEGGLILKVYSRTLDENDGGWTRLSAPAADSGENFHERGHGAARDHLWIRAAEWKALIPPADAKAGMRYPVPEPLARRIVRFHLHDNTRGEPTPWNHADVRQANLELVVVAPEKLHLAGAYHLETPSGNRGHTGRIFGNIVCHDGIITDWKMTALGDHWGEGRYTPNARPGRTPLGHAFELVSGADPADRIAPQGTHWLEQYYDQP